MRTKMSTFQPSTILIFGGTGTIGRFITTCIIRAASLHKWTVLLFTSRTPRSSEMSVLLYYWMAQGLNEVIEGDVASAADVRAAYARGVDTVVSALGRGALHRQLELLRLADEEASGVRWFFPSEYGTDVEHNARSAAEQPHQMKLRVRQFVREEIKRVKVTYMVTGPYFDMWVDTVPGLRVAGGFVKETKEAFVINEGQDRVGFCTMWE